MALEEPEDLISVIVSILDHEQQGEEIPIGLRNKCAAMLPDAASSSRGRRGLRSALSDPSARHHNRLPDIVAFIDQSLVDIIARAEDAALLAESSETRSTVLMGAAAGTTITAGAGSIALLSFGTAATGLIAPVVLVGFVASSAIFAWTWDTHRLASSAKTERKRDARNARDLRAHLGFERPEG